MAEPALRTPVALLIFNRPDTTRRVFAAIRAARPATLLVVADGPRPERPDDVERCAAARAVLDGVDWDCELLTDFAATNLGCGARVASGLDWVFGRVDEAIILEDDCLPHPDFFPFCAALLDRFRDDERVMMVGGTNVLGRCDTAASYLFSRYFSIWGWATWRRAWRRYDPALPGWEERTTRRRVASFYPSRGMSAAVAAMFDLAHRQRVDTWDVQWFYACLLSGGLSVVPASNLIANLGSADGTHTVDGLSDPPLPTWPLDVAALRHPEQVAVDAAYDQALYELRLKRSLVQRVRHKMAALRQHWRQRRR